MSNNDVSTAVRFQASATESKQAIKGFAPAARDARFQLHCHE
jgi:hypothetical protein